MRDFPLHVMGKFAAQQAKMLGMRSRQLDLPCSWNGIHGVFKEILAGRDRKLVHRFSGKSAILVEVPHGRKITILNNQSELRATLDDGTGELPVKCILLFPTILADITRGRFSNSATPAVDEPPTPSKKSKACPSPVRPSPKRAPKNPFLEMMSAGPPAIEDSKAAASKWTPPVPAALKKKSKKVADP